jgi:hypothetical protein
VFASCGDYFKPTPSDSDDIEASAVSLEFDTRLSESLSLIGERLVDVWQQFGPRDFPDDNGVSFRNEFVRFPINFINELRFPDSPDNDYWFAANPPRLESLRPRQLMEVIGILHFYSATWDACRGRIDVAQFHKSLDWIHNTYDLPGSMAVEWFEIARTSTDKYSVPTGKRKMYREIAAIIGADVDDELNESAWSGIALIVHTLYEDDEPAHSEWCTMVFG